MNKDEWFARFAKVAQRNPLAARFMVVVMAFQGEMDRETRRLMFSLGFDASTEELDRAHQVLLDEGLAHEEWLQ